MKYLPAMIMISAALSPSGAAPPAAAKCSITIEAQSSETRVGSELFVNIHLLNTAEREISSRGPQSNGVDTIYQYDCRDEKGASAKKHDRGILNAVGDHPTIAPGESHDELVPIDRTCDFSRPGKYTIQISRSFLDASGESEVIKSNTITIIVLPKSEDAEPK